MEVDERPTEQYSDVGGLDKQIQELIEAVVLPVTHKEKFETLGIQPPKGNLYRGTLPAYLPIYVPWHPTYVPTYLRTVAPYLRTYLSTYRGTRSSLFFIYMATFGLCTAMWYIHKIKVDCHDGRPNTNRQNETMCRYRATPIVCSSIDW